MKVPVERHTRTLDRILGQTIREAARQWLRTIVPLVPVETGMAKATLQPLGELLRVAVPVSPVRKPYYSKLEKGFQSPGTGRLKGKEFELQSTDFQYSFIWSTKVLHYWLSQYYRGNAIPGEEAIQLGEQAFLQKVQQNLETRIPKILEGLIDG